MFIEHTTNNSRIHIQGHLLLSLRYANKQQIEIIKICSMATVELNSRSVSETYVENPQLCEK